MSTSVPSVASPFSHLARNPAPAGKGASDDDDKKKKDEEAKRAEGEKKEEEDAKKKAEEEDKKKKDDEEAKKKAEDDKKKEDAKKKNKADDGDDDSDRDDDENPEARAARARERGRIRAIVESDAASVNMKAATRFALRTRMSRDEAIAHLEGMEPSVAAEPARATDPLRDRMAGVKSPDVGAGDAAPPAPGSAQATAQAIIAAGKKRRGETT